MKDNNIGLIFLYDVGLGYLSFISCTLDATSNPSAALCLFHNRDISRNM
jgi:hypothetical protein